MLAQDAILSTPIGGMEEVLTFTAARLIDESDQAAIARDESVTSHPMIDFSESAVRPRDDSGDA